MTEESFLELSGKDTDYRYDTFTLYFADKSGKKLVKEERNIYYRRTLPKERVVLEQLAKGPMEEGHYAVIPEKIRDPQRYHCRPDLLYQYEQGVSGGSTGCVRKHSDLFCSEFSSGFL